MHTKSPIKPRKPETNENPLPLIIYKSAWYTVRLYADENIVIEIFVTGYTSATSGAGIDEYFIKRAFLFQLWFQQYISHGCLLFMIKLTSVATFINMD